LLVGLLYVEAVWSNGRGKASFPFAQKELHAPDPLGREKVGEYREREREKERFIAQTALLTATVKERKAVEKTEQIYFFKKIYNTSLYICICTCIYLILF